VKSEIRNPKSERRAGFFSSAVFVLRAWLPARRLALLPLGLCLATLASCGVSENPPPPAQGTSDKSVTGGILIPPLAGPAASNHAAFCLKICDAFEQAHLEARTYVDPKDAKESLRYRLFKPPSFEPGKTYPLVLFLHGGGATHSFDDLLKCASPVFAFGPARLVSPEEQARRPAFVVVPWSGGRGWGEENERLILATIEALRREFPLDAKRIYVTGQSMGGYGAWRMITKHPDLFAAGIPVCGGGDPADAPKARDVAVWTFHGTADTIVPVSETRGMVGALVRAGGKPIYWEYEGGTHAKTAERAYCEPSLLDWLFAQAKP
jgi:predicted peptidase